MIKSKFDKNTADAIIPKLSATPIWLSKMMSDGTFRKMLIELYDQNRGSTLLGLSLRQISAMGYHRCFLYAYGVFSPSAFGYYSLQTCSSSLFLATLVVIY
jgi:hypothetical protein